LPSECRSRDLLGHASIVTTERYDNQRDDALFAAAQKLEGRAASLNRARAPRDKSR
jgi:hypothetical protein